MRRWVRRLAHGLAIVAGWALFFWGWQRVLARGTDFSELRLLMLGAAIVVPVVTVSWILHNRGIHRRKGPRRSVPVAALDYRVDFVGRTVVADFRALSQAQRVDIVVDGALKRYCAHHAEEREARLTDTTDLAALAPLAASAPRNAEATQAMTQALTQASALAQAQAPVPAGPAAAAPAQAARSTAPVPGERGDNGTRATS